ncbi:hypothetical protein C9940_05075 [Pseudidiomarina aestuarii]|uniref:Uncharacterized protein n=1 Tax=Pseudidiomarina aestuarii TaxID=624146 RepID=A0A2T4CU38_9GAMM|nr:hypothetical protein C9988_02770 [Pseudidiomarina aestuarii]PTB85732.1 hypothetical protein C9940_05075 [Pseudidiomarina aestuarii]PTB89877.1 hypothetical protein C9928_02015 [Pseudidiomarina aestuarii]
MRIYIRQLQQKVGPRPGANPLMMLLSWLVMGLLLMVGLFLGLVFLLVGWILLLPLMWKRRRELKSMWQFGRAAKQAQQQARQQQDAAQQQQRNRQDSSVIDGEYRVKDD